MKLTPHDIFVSVIGGFCVALVAMLTVGLFWLL